MALHFDRRSLLAGLGAGAACGFAPQGLRIPVQTKRDLWRRAGGPHLRGAVFVQRPVYPRLDGDTFLGGGTFGPPITDRALDQLAEAGANLASWSGPGLRAERSPFEIDPEVEDHIGQFLDRCRARGLFATLCFRSGPGRSAFAFHPGEAWYPADFYDATIWLRDEAQAAWIQMVVDALERFGDHPALAGVVPMEEPNGADLGHTRVWPVMAGQLARAVRSQPGLATTPLLYSPDRWARVEALGALRREIFSDDVVALHDYEPWDFTHQATGTSFTYDREAMTRPEFQDVQGDWSMLEFGAVRYAPGVESFIQDRISNWEALGANWTVFRWSSGWSVYEQAEGAMSLSDDPRILPILRQAFGKNRVRPT